jgi:DNA-directed RNA polymerase subunit RPC12/RpoP
MGALASALRAGGQTMSPTYSLVKKLTKCARCGIDIEQPMKEWNMQPKDGRGPALHVKHYACPQCGKTFRVADKLIGA